MDYKLTKKQGFSILEMLAVLAILILVIFFSYSAFVSLNETQVLDKDTEALSALFEEAKSNTRSSIEDSHYGVYLELGSSKAVLFKGEIYDENDPQNKELIFNNKVSISLVDLIDGGDSVVFERPKGDTLDSGNIVLLLNGNTASSTINIYPTGTIEIS